MFRLVLLTITFILYSLHFYPFANGNTISKPFMTLNAFFTLACNVLLFQLRGSNGPPVYSHKQSFATLESFLEISSASS